MKVRLIKDRLRQLLVEIVGGVRESGEDNYFLIVWIYRVRKFLLQVLTKDLQLAVVFWGDVFEHLQQQGEDVLIGF